VDLALPSELVAGVELFKSFYEGDNQRRKLSWIYSLGTAMVRGRFDPKPIEITMNTMQAAVCVLFNDVDELTYAEIRVRASA
jgi:cullin 1